VITIPTDRLWTADEIEGFRPAVDAWKYTDYQAFLVTPFQGFQMENYFAFHKVYKSQIKALLLATPLEELMKRPYSCDNKSLEK